MDEVVVRTATVEDVAALSGLRRAFTFEDAEPDHTPREDFEEAFALVVTEGIRSGDWVVWIAELDGAVVSHAFVGVIEKIPRPIVAHRAIGYLTNVYTRPDLRGRGIGGRVLDAVVAWALESDIELMVVWPSDESLAHYARHGFAPRGEPLVWMHPDGLG